MKQCQECKYNCQDHQINYRGLCYYCNEKIDSYQPQQTPMFINPNRPDWSFGDKMYPWDTIPLRSKIAGAISILLMIALVVFFFWGLNQSYKKQSHNNTNINQSSK